MEGTSNFVSSVLSGAYAGTVTETSKSTATDEFSSILSNIKAATEGTNGLTGVKAVENESKLTDNETAETTVKEILLMMFSGNIEGAAEKFAALSDTDKAEVFAMLQNLISSATSELSGESKKGSTQALLSSLFADEIPDKDKKSSAEEILEVLLGKSSDDDEDIDNSDILSTMMSMLGDLSTNTSDNSDVQSTSNSLTITDGNTTYSMILEEYVKAMQQILDGLTGKTDTKVITDTASDKNISDIQTGLQSGVVGTNMPEQIASASATLQTPATNETTVTSQTISANMADEAAEMTAVPVKIVLDNARTQSYGTLSTESSSARSKLLSEGNVAKTSFFSQRLNQKSNELESIFSDLSTAASFTGQAVDQTVKFDAVQSVVEIPAETQIAASITEQLPTLGSGETKEMTITLNPESLGKIAIKIENNAGEITVTLAAQSEVTQKLLQDKLPILVSNLQNVNTDVKDVKIVEANQSADFASFNLANSDSGQNSGAFSESRPQTTGGFTLDSVNQAKEIVPDIFENEYKGENMLWQTA